MPTQFLSGGCQCGAVRYTLAAAPDSVHLCHCRMCQKAVGGPFAALAPVDRDALTWTRGTPATFQSSSAAARDFCAACGTPLTFRYLQNNRVAVTIGSLDTPDAAVPTKLYGLDTEVPWLRHAVAGGLPAAPAISPTGPAYIRTLTSYQHPDHDTPADWSPPRG